LPFEPLLARLGFRKVVSLPESFTPGRGPANIDVPGAGLAGLLICYEAIFPHRLVADVRPAWLVNVTNDGWFGMSVGPHQHLAQMRMRAIEQGLAVARAANTGISAIIDPLGRITARSELGVAAVVDGKLPAEHPPTVYARLGDVVLLLLMCGFVLLLRLFAWQWRLLNHPDG
jgi:apolipoprotein N-acyltransferase